MFILESKWFAIPITLVFIVLLAISAVGTSPRSAEAYGECTQYGYMAIYDSYTNTCSCMSGYRFDDSYFGKQCVSDLTYCTSTYGYGATSDYAGNCECSRGYIMDTNVIGQLECVTGSSYCRGEYGFMSTYSSLSNSCGCSYGYVFDTGIFGDKTCRNGDTVCREDHGIYSDYSSTKSACVCDSGYTFDDNDQCVKKQNNVYFWVDEHDSSTREAIIKNATTSQRYLIKYGFQCFTTSFDTYVGSRIVVNLGTDFFVDAWSDTVVLPNHDQVCDITSAKSVSSSFTLGPSYTNGFLYQPSGTGPVYYYSNGTFYLVPDDGTFAAKRFSWSNVQDISSAEIVATGSTPTIIKEGAIIRAIGGIDVYIVKYMGSKGFKRLVLSPTVFESYGHLRWSDIMDVSQSTVDSFATADLVRVAGDPQIYKLIPQGDEGIRQPISDAALARLGLDSESIYEINSVDRGSYTMGAAIN